MIVTTANGHANDSDAIVGDNGDIIRLVGVNGTVAPPVGPLVIAGSVALNGNPVQTFNGFLRFNYDSNTADGSRPIARQASTYSWTVCKLASSSTGNAEMR